MLLNDKKLVNNKQTINILNPIIFNIEVFCPKLNGNKSEIKKKKKEIVI